MTYTVVINVLCGLLLLLVPRLVRGAADFKDDWSLAKPIFICIVLFAFVPLSHLVYMGCLSDATHYFFWGAISVIAFLTTYIIGVIFMITKWPESRWPGKFDYWFQSHQIWHVCVVIGALIQYAGSREVRIVCILCCVLLYHLH